MSRERVSIIIPCKQIDRYAVECVESCKQLDYEDFEILLLPDEEMDAPSGVRIIATGPVSPGRKRNIGIENSTGEFCAFIDSDAYPRKDWLKNAVHLFNDDKIGAVGGPGVTPPDDAFLRKAGGAVLASLLVSGKLSVRYKEQGIHEADDIHSCNLIVRRDILQQIGGWNERYWPGEDTLLCRAIHLAGWRMVLASDVSVFHHRRSLYRPHMKQVHAYGRHRGFFAKKYPETSSHLIYALPSLFVIAVVGGGLLAILIPGVAVFYGWASAVYAGISLVAAGSVAPRISFVPAIWIGTWATHVAYGSGYIGGILARELKQ